MILQISILRNSAQGVVYFKSGTFNFSICQWCNFSP